MKRNRGFTLVELLVVIGVIVVLIALLLPAIGIVRGRARSAQCQSNLAEIGIALGKANSTMPQPLRASEWPVRLPTFLDGETELLNCPSESEGGTSYGMNDRVHRMQGGDGQKITMLDYRTEQAEIVRGSVADQNWESSYDPRHRGQINMLLYGGSVVSHDPETIDPRVCKPFLDFWRPMRDHGTVLSDCTVASEPPVSTTDGSTDDSSTDGTTDSSTDGAPPEESGCDCYVEDSGFPEVLEGYYLQAHLCSSDTSGQYPPYIDIPLDGSHERVRMEGRTANSYSLNFEDWLDWDWSDHILTLTRESNGDITVCYVRDGAGYEASLYDPPFGSEQLSAPGTMDYLGMLPNPFGGGCAQNPVGTCTTIPGNMSGRCLNVVAGPDAISSPHAAVSLDGDSFATTGGDVTLSWHKVSGPGTVTFTNPDAEDTDATFSEVGTYKVRLHATDGSCEATDDVTVTINAGGAVTARYVRVGENPGNVISLAEVEVYDAAGTNRALAGTASHISTRWGGEAHFAIDGDNNCAGPHSHSGGNGPDEWWEVDLGQNVDVALIRITTRCDGGWQWNHDMVPMLLDANRNVIWTGPEMDPNGVDPVYTFFPQ